MTIVIRSQAGTGPNDLVAVVLSDKLRKPFGPVRIGVDLTFALVGLALGGVVGLGTVICAFLVGPAAQLFFSHQPAACARPRWHNLRECAPKLEVNAYDHSICL